MKPAVLLLIVLHCGATVVARASDASAYRSDVEFLLDELEKKCRHLFDRKGVKWDAVEKRFRKEVKKVKSDVEHFQLVQRILASLRDGHAGIVEIHFEWPDDQTPAERKGVGMSLCLEGKTVLIKDCHGPAAAAGFKSGWELKSIDGVAALKWLNDRADRLADTHGCSTRHAALYNACHHGLADVPGTSWSFEAKSGGRGTKKTTLTCASGGGNGVPNGPIFPPKELTSVERHGYGRLPSGFGYAHLRNVPQNLCEQMDEILRGLGPVEGLVLDFRANGGGGVDHDAFFGRFLAPGESFGGVRGLETGEHFTGRVVVVVDAGTRSAGETLAGRFKATKRGYLIGPTPTAGMSGRKEDLKLPSGLMTVRVTIDSFSADKEIEGYGVEPNEIVAFDGEAMEDGIDPFLRRAEELLRGGFPRGAVTYGAQ